MARRPYSDTRQWVEDESLVDAYLVRVVFLPTDWQTKRMDDGVPVWDIQNFVRFAGFDSAEEPLWEKLRGGRFYVHFSHDD
jgi:hypothetical protein